MATPTRADRLKTETRQATAARGGQWKAKVKIADDFDELPESFMEGFHGDKDR